MKIGALASTGDLLQEYVQDDGRLIFNKGKVYFIRNQNTGDIVSVVISDKTRKRWVKHDE